MEEAWPLVGRDEELRRVARALSDPERAGVILAGPGGVGKSRLATESAALAEAAGFSTEAILATRSSSRIPLGAFAPLLPVEDPEAQDQLKGARAAILARAEEEPLLLVVDDAQLLDPASATLVLQLARDDRIFVVATIRSTEPTPDAVVALWKDGGCDRLDLAPLDTPAVSQLLERVLGGPIAVSTVDDLVAASAGVPLMLRELVVASREVGSLVLADGVWQLRGHPALSTRLVELISQRLDGLAAEPRRVMTVLGLTEPLDLVVLESLTDRPTLVDLEDRSLIQLLDVEGRTLVRSAHPLYGEVAVEVAGELQRREVLQQVADARWAAGAGEEDVLRVVDWWLRAGHQPDPDLVVRAARRAYMMTAYDKTLELSRLAWDRTQNVEAGHLLGFALGRRGDHAEAEAVLAEVAERVDTDRMRALATLARADNLFRSAQDAESAITVTEEAEGMVTDPEWRDELRASRAMLIMNSGRPGEALAMIEDLLEPGTPPRPFVKAAYAAGPALANDGRADQAMELAARALPIHEEVWQTDLFQTEPGVHHITTVLGLIESGRLVEAESFSEVAFAVASELETDYARAWFSMLRGLVALHRGRVATAGRFCREAVSPFRAARFLGPLRWTLSGVALSCAYLGDAVGARAALAEVDSVETSMRFNEGTVDNARGWTLVAEGRPEAARELFDTAADAAIERGERAAGAQLLHHLARVGGADRAAARLGDLAGVLDGELTPVRAAYAAALSTDDGAGLEASGARFEEMGGDLYAAEAFTEADRAYRRAGDQRRATGASRRAAELAARCEGADTPGLQASASITPLTDREREVARLAVDRLSSKEIADRLHVSRRTVDNHLQRAYTKLGISGRDELAAALGDPGGPVG